MLRSLVGQATGAHRFWDMLVTRPSGLRSAPDLELLWRHPAIFASPGRSSVAILRFWDFLKLVCSLHFGFRSGLGCFFMDLFDEHEEENFEVEEDAPAVREASDSLQRQGSTPTRPTPRKLEDLSLDEILTRIKNLAKPPPPRDFGYFKDICSLPSVGTNAHKLQSGKHVSVSSLQAMFGVGRGRSGFRFMDCKDQDARKVIAKLWPLVYGKPNLPPNKLISKEFCLGIVAQTKLGMQVDWASFAEETNADQRSKYATTMRKYENIRDRKLAAGERSQVQCDSAVLGSVSQSTARASEAQLSKEEVKPKLMSSSPHWISQIASEVGQLLNVLSFELAVSKSVLVTVQKERDQLIDQCRTQRMLVESMLASLLEETEGANEFSTREKSNDTMTTSSALGLSNSIGGSVGGVASLLTSPANSSHNGTETPHELVAELSEDKDTLPTPTLYTLHSDELIRKTMAQRCLENLHIKHEAQLKSLQAQLEIKERDCKEESRRCVFQERQCAILREQHSLLQKMLPGLFIQPHPMCYSNEIEDSKLAYMLVTDCALCEKPFPLNDIIVGHCRHLYHPWCAMSHFRLSCHCAHPDCKVQMSFGWLKSFGFKEPDASLYPNSELQELEESRLATINLRKEIALAVCPELGMPILPPLTVISQHTRATCTSLIYSVCCVACWCNEQS